MLARPGQRRHALKWVRSLRRNYLLDQPSPWICFDAIEFLGRWLESRRDVRAFEYGSGGSTLFWRDKAAFLVSIEHDAAWFEVVRCRLMGSPHVDYRLVEPEALGQRDSGPADPADPRCYRSGGEEFAGYDFRTYVSQIDPFPDGYFDVVMVDGRARPSCLAHSSSKVAPGGILILDNADRSYYTTRTAQYLQRYEKHVFSGAGPVNAYQWRTDIYVRPEQEAYIPKP
ncbi:MAG TPA: hypothetical protein VMW56_13140 [Candidatus Margulisiibacteriota bacterium]|nr:hypothetical protein [Candidatus Margulisiibacteriota bacterium]